MYITVAFIFGVIIGSFLNVVLMRMHTGKGFGGRSHCMSCGETLTARQLIPVVSYVVQRGRCVFCTSRISSRYAVTELLTGLLFAGVAYVYIFDIVALVGMLAVMGVLVLIFMYDIRHTIIPNELVLILTGLAALLLGYSVFMSGDMAMLMWHMVSALVTFIFFASFWFVSRGRWMGLGDAKLAAPLAFLLGPDGSVSMVLLAFWIGTIYVLVSMGINKIAALGRKNVLYVFPRYTIKSEVPFAPFIIVGFLVVLFFHVDVFSSIQTIADAFTVFRLNS